MESIAMLALDLARYRQADTGTIEEFCISRGIQIGSACALKVCNLAYGIMRQDMVEAGEISLPTRAQRDFAKRGYVYPGEPVDAPGPVCERVEQ